MTLISLETRLRKIEQRRARVGSPQPTKEQRDALIAYAAAEPGAEARSLAAQASIPGAALREQSAAAVAAFLRADT